MRTISKFGAILTNGRSRCSPTQSTSRFKDKYGYQKRPFRVVQLVYLAKEWIENGARKHVAAAVPADICNRAIRVCDRWYSSS
jgi:hypothetical protein